MPEPRISAMTCFQTAFAPSSMSDGITGAEWRGSGSVPFSLDGRVSPRASLAAFGSRAGPCLPTVGRR
jgi:hypothetical protein